jgi:hypothetical protein
MTGSGLALQDLTPSFLHLDGGKAGVRPEAGTFFRGDNARPFSYASAPMTRFHRSLALLLVAVATAGSAFAAAASADAHSRREARHQRHEARAARKQARREAKQHARQEHAAKRHVAQAGGAPHAAAHRTHP